MVYVFPDELPPFSSSGNKRCRSSPVCSSAASGVRIKFTPRPPPLRHEATHRHFSFFRTINLKNPVLQQVLERRNEVLCVLIQKIATTQKCVISEHIQVEEKCGGIVGIQTKTVQVQAPRGRGAGLSGPEVRGQRPEATASLWLQPWGPGSGAFVGRCLHSSGLFL